MDNIIFDLAKTSVREVNQYLHHNVETLQYNVSTNINAHTTNVKILNPEDL